MDQQTYHGPITPKDFARGLIAEFDQGNLRARQVGRGDNIVVQIASPQVTTSGGRTALAVHLSKIEDGVLIRIGQQQWLGVAASMGVSVLSTLLNPRSLLRRLDDIAQDIHSLQLGVQVWETIERVADSLGASYELSERLRRLTCEYCYTANPVGAPHCVGCGAPLGLLQPTTCRECGYVVKVGEIKCPQCGVRLVE